VKIHVPSGSTADTNSVISTRRGRILGFDSRTGWQGWDTVEAEIPQSELHDLIVELRSLTQGVGTYEMKFDHLAELTGKLAENVVAARKAAA
jgi:elongation factor G